MPLLRKVEKYISKHNLLQHTDQPVVVALSGGMDSVCLLHILHRLEYQLIAAHCNFHLRGEESERDMHFVENLCKTLGIPLYIKQFDTLTYAETRKLSVEMAARELRYSWFEQLLQEQNAQAIVVAHHESDQAETLLLNLCRGTGLKGLCGMHPKNGHIIRPLLEIAKKDIEAYITLNHISFVTDSTNTDTAIKRNEIRYHLQGKDATVKHIAHTATYLREYQDFIDNIINYFKPQLLRDNRLDTTKLMKLPNPQIILYELLKDYGFRQTEKVFSAIINGKTGRQFVSQDNKFTLCTDRGFLIISEKNVGEEPVLKIDMTIRNKNSKEIYPKADALEALFDAKINSQKLTLRHPEDGDSFCPIGMNGKRKLVADLLAEQKVPLTEKKKVWLLQSGNEIAWVVGYRISEHFKVTDKCQQIAHIQIITD